MSDKDESGAGSERRTEERHFACFPAYFERKDKGPRTTMIRDLSRTGALLLARSDLPVGEVVHLQLFILDDLAQFRAAKGRVVRVEPIGDDAIGLWTRRIAIEFDEPLAIAEEELQALRERQDRLGSTPPPGSPR